MLFNGNPQMPVTNCQSLTAYLRSILAKTPHGARDVRFKSETRVSCLSVQRGVQQGVVSWMFLATECRVEFAVGWHVLADCEERRNTWPKSTT